MDVEKEQAIIMDEEWEQTIIIIKINGWGERTRYYIIVMDEWREEAIIMDKERGQAIIYNGWGETTMYYNGGGERASYYV